MGQPQVSIICSQWKKADGRSGFEYVNMVEKVCIFCTFANVLSTEAVEATLKVAICMLVARQRSYLIIGLAAFM